MSGPLNKQVGGDHYKGYKIQPGVFCQLIGLGFFESSIIKRIARFDKPGGKMVEDIEKMIHEFDLISVSNKETIVEEDFLDQFTSEKRVIIESILDGGHNTHELLVALLWKYSESVDR